MIQKGAKMIDTLKIYEELKETIGEAGQEKLLIFLV